MKNPVPFNSLTKGLVFVVIIVHLMFFILEALFWMQPLVHNILLVFLDNPVDLTYPVQAITLRNLFVNQGFYNLFLVIGGIAGYQFVLKGKLETGFALILFLCFAGVGAGIVLACSTKAYLLALLQGIPAAFAFTRVYAVYKTLPTY